MQSSHDSDSIIRKDTWTDSESGSAYLISIVFDRRSWSKRPYLLRRTITIIIIVWLGSWRRCLVNSETLDRSILIKHLSRSISIRLSGFWSYETTLTSILIFIYDTIRSENVMIISSSFNRLLWLSKSTIRTHESVWHQYSRLINSRIWCVPSVSVSIQIDVVYLRGSRIEVYVLESVSSYFSVDSFCLSRETYESN